MDNAEKYLEENRGLVESIANKYAIPTTKFSRDDLVQEGNLAVVKALEKFDESRSKSKLSTYIYSAVNRTCRDFVRRNINDLRVSNNQQAKDYIARKTEEPSAEDKPKAYGSFGTTESPIAIRLDKPTNTPSEEVTTIGCTIPASGDASLLDSVVKKEQIDILLEEIDKLPERERDVFRAHYIDGEKYSNIARDMGLTRQRIHQISKVAMNKVSEKVKERLEFELFV